MSRVNAYYEVTKNYPLKKLCLDYHKQHKKAWVVLNKLLKAHGAHSIAMSQGTLFDGKIHLKGFSFNQGKCPPYCKWCDRAGYYTPRINTAEGKKLRKELAAVEALFPNLKEIKECLGWEDVITVSAIWGLGFSFTKKGRIFISVPLFSKSESTTINRGSKNYKVPRGLKEVVATEFFYAFNR